MSASRIRVRNNPLNAHRTNADRKAYRAMRKAGFAKINTAATDAARATAWAALEKATAEFERASRKESRTNG